jgi:hypothetical protein
MNAESSPVPQTPYPLAPRTPTRLTSAKSKVLSASLLK